MQLNTSGCEHTIRRKSHLTPTLEPIEHSGKKILRVGVGTAVPKYLQHSFSHRLQTACCFFKKKRVSANPVLKCRIRSISAKMSHDILKIKIPAHDYAVLPNY